MPLSEAVSAYLRRVGVDDEPPPTYDTLRLLHRAHLDVVPYENLSTMLGRPPSPDPAASLARVGAVGRAGYCFHQNGALGAVLAELGFAVDRRHGHVYTSAEDRDDAFLNHLVLVVDGLPTDANPGGRWWVDVGLGDAFRDPFAVTVGRHDQDGFRYEITEVREDGWSFLHDRSGTFAGIEVSSRPTDQRAVDAAHATLTTPPGGRFAQLLVVQRRDGAGVDTVRGCLHHRTVPDGRTKTELASYDAWREALVDGTRLPLEGVDEDELRALYAAQWDKHLAWTAAGRP
ncbi:arylamine N-acetyltransferase family protein [Nocardioides halotolerans]|uniref:arylamine N-acetyltransferase family protein n=1 Tax=Nocardioides halotolerans TaxID=433660 RepID=UPI0003F81E37|nr:arylamine N-acetyltransferase [Nocardioides halotolerans]